MCLDSHPNQAVIKLRPRIEFNELISHDSCDENRIATCLTNVPLNNVNKTELSHVFRVLAENQHGGNR